ncbi:DUF6059 family protein [Streptomyces sp. 7N604]|uniref:DUF6059 family protein n=1 Tax=Streptomyces sp. 7N604 TaxID=3457415 RepID=UPI003FD382D2
MGQCLGAYTSAECYGFVPGAGSLAGPAAGSAAGPAAGPPVGPSAGERVPGPGHPERLVPFAAPPASERAIWRQLEEVWERAEPEPGVRTRQSRRRRPHPRRG